MFDPNAFLNDTQTAAFATRRDPLPPGEVLCQITKLDTVSGEKNGRSWYKLNVVLDIADPAYLEKAQRDKATITYGILLDMNEGGGLAMGPNRNIALGKLREATGTNIPGKPLSAMIGQYVKAMISHRPDPVDPSIVYDDVKGVTRA